jgi:type I restriction-modification system DNA methylase subunit
MQNIQTKNKFDEIIEKMITENINGIDDSLYNLEHTEKISKVFKTVDSTGSFSKLDLSKKPKMDHLKSVITMLKDYVKVGEVKKKEAGEVMTPLELVKEMLSTLPEDVWSNPNLKWLDSCNGSGPFLVMVIYKLMIGLKDWESDEEKRYKHIVENMIYAGELQPKNMFLFVSAIDPFDEYNLNIYTGSFLEKEFDNI